MHLHFSQRTKAFMLLALILIISFPALVSFNSTTQLEAIQTRGILRVVTINSPSTYFLDHGKQAGFEYELSKAFAEHLGVKLELIPVPRLEDVFDNLRLRSAHLAAAGLTMTPERRNDFTFSVSYRETAPTLVYRVRRGNPSPKSLSDLYGKTIAIPSHSSHSELLSRLKATKAPELSWEEFEDDNTSELLEQVHRGIIDYTVADSSSFDLHRSFFPGLERGLVLGERQQIGWMLSQKSDGSLLDAVNGFLSLESTQQLIGKLEQRYFKRSNSLNYFDTVTFKQDLEERFAPLEQYFHLAEQQTGLNWMLLAAIAYQESHWKANAVSPTGVRGIMMLTRAAAKEVGVKKRTDPIQSILGGAQYLKRVMAKIPVRIQGDDRVWMALASYNVGYGHLEDARVLAARAGKNPDKWHEVKQFLPLLTQKRYYSSVRHGYARGYEPVIYVTNIQKYLKLLEWERQLLQVRHQRQNSAAQPETKVDVQLPPTL